jgi:mRNA-degrading endonuclease RelE of RelBE toxin-antitoxin system
MQVVIFAAFENQLGSAGKKYKFDTEKFFRNLCRDIGKNPKADAVLIAETESYQVFKRRVKNPKIGKGKSHGFRVRYCVKKDEIYFCLFEDATEKKIKEKSTQYHPARIREAMKEEPGKGLRTVQ